MKERAVTPRLGVKLEGSQFMQQRSYPRMHQFSRDKLYGH